MRTFVKVVIYFKKVFYFDTRPPKTYSIFNFSFLKKVLSNTIYLKLFLDYIGNIYILKLFILVITYIVTENIYIIMGQPDIKLFLISMNLCITSTFEVG